MSRIRQHTDDPRSFKVPNPVEVGLWMRGSRARFALITGGGAIAILLLGSTMKNWHSSIPGWHAVIDCAPPAAFVFLAVPCVRACALELDEVASRRGGRSAGTTIRMVTTVVGYLLVLLVALGLTDYPVEHLLLGGAIIGVILGIAAQQSLGNVFAGLVLLLARPFTIGNSIRIRSGALGGEFSGTVLSMSLTYVSVLTAEGELKVPNSSVMAAAVGLFRRPGEVRSESAPSHSVSAQASSDSDPG